MSVSHYNREISSEITRVHGESIQQLIRVATSYLDSPDNTYRIEDGGIVFERPMGESLLGRNES